MRYKKILVIAILSIVSLSAHSGAHLISPVDYGVVGTEFIYKTAWIMTVGENSFKDFSEFVTYGNPVDGDTVFVEAGTYDDNVTIAVKGLVFMGNNAWCQTRSGNRVNEESIITGQLTIVADNITINGFQFTGNGCVVNETATNANPLSGFKFIFNDVVGSTISRTKNKAVLKLGNQYGPTDGGLDAAAHCRYNGVTVSHNSFAGSDASPAHFVHIGGSYGKTDIVDNTFNDGGCSVTLANTQGEVNVLSNIFTNVGDLDRYFGDVNGDLSVYLYYIAYSNTTTVNIQNNVFDKCLGRSSMFAPIRFFNGDAEQAQLSPVGCRINLNYNIFKNKPKESGSNYNYVFYTNYNEEAEIDTRFNQFDNGDMALAQVKQPWEWEATRNMASSYELIDFASASNTEFGYFKDPCGNEVKAVDLEQSTRVAQSFDIDEKTGDIFFIQIYPEKEWNGIALNAEEPLVVTRYYKHSETGVMTQQRMYLDNAGHGSNMAVCRHNGIRYIVTGGDGEVVNGSTQSNCTSFIPYVPGAVADCSKTSFSKDGTTYEIKKFYNPLGDGNPYPSVDQTSRLFLERNTSGANIRMCIYNLDDVIEQGGNATPLKVVTIKKATTSAVGDDPNSSIPGDRGFQTWDPQGLTISGDYLYFAEGVGEDNEDAIDAEPTVIIHAYNWKTDKFAYRKRVKRNLILNLVHGEPEGIKVHRDAYGRPNLLLGIASGLAGARRANIFACLPSPNTLSSTGVTFDIPVGISSASVDELNFKANWVGVYPENFTVSHDIEGGGENATLNGNLQLTISGEDASCFSVVAENTGAFDKESNITVNYSPSTIKENHTAVLRISSPNASDVLIPLIGVYTGPLTGIDEVETSECVAVKREGDVITFSQEVVRAEIYDLTGIKCGEGDEFINIKNMTKGIYLVRCYTCNGVVVRKIKI